MLTLPGPSSCTLTLVGLVCGLSTTRPMMKGPKPSSPMPAGVLPRPRTITQPTNWSFSLSSGLWLRSSHEYLYELTFNVHTDNNPLMFVLTTVKLDAVSHCWVASLADYNFQLYYMVGKANINADALMRVSWHMCMPDAWGTHH